LLRSNVLESSFQSLVRFLSQEIDYTQKRPAIDYFAQDKVSDTLSLSVGDANALIDQAPTLGYFGDDDSSAASPLDTQRLSALGLLGVVTAKTFNSSTERLGTTVFVKEWPRTE
jgi:hypothetical protein